MTASSRIAASRPLIGLELNTLWTLAGGMMKRFLAGLATAGLVGSGASPATEFRWLETSSLESHLGDSADAIILASDFVSQAYSLCAVGSYAHKLPAGYP
jgi:hypothetical protein